jgi:hypothetical protein
MAECTAEIDVFDNKDATWTQCGSHAVDDRRRPGMCDRMKRP